ncbi:MAG: DUF5677 domain-containing protein [Bacteroidota bacterium]|nr:DUF5677 domain-containing protein [Bacteroidota bacterium]
MEDFRTPHENLTPALNHFVQGIENLVNFGVQIVGWDLDQEGKSDEHLPPILFLRNYIEVIDAISILVRHSSIDPCKNLLRTALENLANIEYLLEKDTNQRSLSFLVWNFVNGHMSALKVDGKSLEYKQLRDAYNKDRFLKTSTPSIHPDAEQAKANSVALLAHDKYKAVHLEYRRTAKRIQNPNWYSLFNGPRTMKKLCEHLEINVLYELVYRTFSESIHGTDIIQGMIYSAGPGRSAIAQIRHPVAVHNVTTLCTNLTLVLYTDYIQKRLPDKHADFLKWKDEIMPFQKSLYEQEFINFV